ncbi:hypothetical protein C8R47DRAFT_1248874 [Mycena vitilis]|nr:hypothetical protein C8R47DRAFT_1248874 [Mycena vitilis]
MSSMSSIPILPVDKQLDGDANWGTWNDTIMNLLRRKGLDGYPKGLITPSVAATYPGLYAVHPTPINSRAPSAEEAELRCNMASAIMYQNILDPQAHNITAKKKMTSLWRRSLRSERRELGDAQRGSGGTLRARLRDGKSQGMMIGCATDGTNKAYRLDGAVPNALPQLELHKGVDLLAHLQTLVKLCADANRIGCHIRDEEMISISLGTLPAEEFGQSIMTLQVMKRLGDVLGMLNEYWDMRYKKAAEAAAAGAVASALAASVPSGMSCGNCLSNGHTKEACWALGGGREGQAPHWWRAPKGKEPRQAMIDASKAAKAQAPTHPHVTGLGAILVAVF